MDMINTGYVRIGEKAKRLMQKVLDTSRISCGEYVAQFEKEYAKKHQIKYAVAVGSGTEADIIALLSLVAKGKLRLGDAVLVPAICFISVANAVHFAGLKPVFVDTDPFNMKFNEIEDAIFLDDIKAIIAVHFGGFPIDIEGIRNINGVKDIPIIEDCACAHGTIVNGKIAGSQGDLSTWSLYVAHIVTAGGGGVIGTNDDELAELIYSIRSYGRSCTCRPCRTNTTGMQCMKRFKEGQDIRFLYQRLGLNSRMTEMEAVIGLDQMDVYDEIIMYRRNHFTYLKNMLIEKAGTMFTTFPNIPDENFKMSPIFFPMILREYINRNKVVSILESKGIETRNLYACIPTQQPAYSAHFQSKERFPNAERLGDQGFYVGIHQGLSKDDLEYMADKITIAMKGGIR